MKRLVRQMVYSVDLSSVPGIDGLPEDRLPEDYKPPEPILRRAYSSRQLAKELSILLGLPKLNYLDVDEIDAFVTDVKERPPPKHVMANWLAVYYFERDLEAYRSRHEGALETCQAFHRTHHLGHNPAAPERAVQMEGELKARFMRMKAGSLYNIVKAIESGEEPLQDAAPVAEQMSLF